MLVQLVGLRRLLQLARRKRVVVPLDEEPLAFAYLFPQRVSLARIFGSPPHFVETAVGTRHPGVGHGKIRIKLRRPLEEGQRRGVPFRVAGLHSQAVGFQRLQRWRGRFLHRRGVFLHRAQRLAQLAPQTDCRSVQSLEHRFLARRLLLRFRQHVPRVAVHCLQANHVLAAQPRNRPGQHGLAAGALADLAGDLRRQPVTGRTAHQLQGLVHPALGNQVEKG